MTPDDIAVLLRIKQAREQHAETALRQASAAQLRVVKARGQADLAAADFATIRPAQEAAVYRALAAGPIEGHQLRQAAAQLSGIVAYAEVLGQRAAQAARHATTCAEALATARHTRAAALRDTLGAETMHQRLAMVVLEAAQHRHDAELEELAARRDRAAPGWPQP